MSISQSFIALSRISRPRGRGGGRKAYRLAYHFRLAWIARRQEKGKRKKGRKKSKVSAVIQSCPVRFRVCCRWRREGGKKKKNEERGLQHLTAPPRRKKKREEEGLTVSPRLSCRRYDPRRWLGGGEGRKGEMRYHPI